MEVHMKRQSVRLASILLLSVALAWSAWSCSSPSDLGRNGGSPASDADTGLHEARPGGKGMRLRRGQERPAGPSLVALSAGESRALEIETERVARRPMRSSLQAAGKILAPQTKKAIVSYPFPARIAGIHVRTGEWVAAGRKLVTLQSEEVGVAKSDFFKARADFELARSGFEREKRLHEGGVGAQKNLLAAEAGLKVASAGLDAAEKKLHLLGFSEEQVRAINGSHEINPVIDLYAPLAGKVIENNAVLGAMVDESKEILTIIDPAVLWVDAEVYERDLARVRPGLEVEVRVPAYPGQVFPGRVTYIGDVLKEETRTITVRAEVSNRDGRLKPGMFADIALSLENKSGCLAVPREAVLEDGRESIVFILKNGAYLRRTVKTGLTDDGYVEILEGVAEGEEVVTEGNFRLKSKLYGESLKKAHVH
jgi:cobalt-zinc-cadmium efflux system membrane fusion protein